VTRRASLDVFLDGVLSRTLMLDVPTGIGAREELDFGYGSDADPLYRVRIERLPNRREVNGIVVPSLPVFAALECNVCGFRHQVDGFKPRQEVRIVAVDEKDPQCRLGMYGQIVSWSQYGGPITYYVRVHVGDDPTWSWHEDGSQGPYRFAYFEPCALEAA
jgi:hypothetical protein